MLIFPPASIYPEEEPPLVFPLGIGYLSAILEKKGYDVHVQDCMVNDGTLTKNEDGTLHAGLTWRQIKKEIDDIPVIFGGARTTAMPKEVLSNKTIDYVVIGEGEIALSRLLEHIGNRDSLSKIYGIGYKLCKIQK